jgi:hypothetical protein
VDQPGLARIDATAGVDPACPGLLRLTDPTSPCLRPTTVFLDGLGWKGQSQLAPSTHESYVDQAPPRPSQQAMFHPTLSSCLNLASLDQASLNWMGPPQPPTAAVTADQAWLLDWVVPPLIYPLQLYIYIYIYKYTYIYICVIYIYIYIYI